MGFLSWGGGGNGGLFEFARLCGLCVVVMGKVRDWVVAEARGDGIMRNRFLPLERSIISDISLRFFIVDREFGIHVHGAFRGK